jgi:hypothetical protein
LAVGRHRLLPSARGIQGQAAKIEVGQAAADAREVTRLLEQHGQRFHARRQLDLQLASSTAVMMRTDRGLIHAGDQCGTASRAHWRGDVGPRKLCAFRSQSVQPRSLNQRLAVARELRRHVIDDEPKHMGPLRGRCGMTAEHRQQSEQRRNAFCRREHAWFHDRILLRC